MANLLNYVGTGSRVGGRNNIWSNVLFFFNVGDGTFNELSPNRISFTGTTYYLGNREPFNLRVELLSDIQCDIRWQERTYRNIPYQIISNAFVADLERGTQLYMSRYNQVETSVSVITNISGESFGTAYHLQPV